MKKPLRIFTQCRALCACVIVALWVAGTAPAQAQTRGLTFRIENATIKEIIGQIKKTGGYDFMYADEDIAGYPRRSVDFVNESIDRVMHATFIGTNLHAEIKGKMIVVKKINPYSVGDNSYRVIAGQITGPNKQPLAGVTVVVKGTTTGTSTDASGHYSIRIPVRNVTLLFTYIGMVSREVEVTDQLRIDLQMAEDAKQIDDVVITGYQQIDRRHMTSAVTTVKMEDIDVPGINTIDRLLEGRVAGITYMQNSGQVGVVPRIRVRGTSSILGNQEPLWVVDGIIIQDPVNIDPRTLNDLDFVNVLGNAIAGVNPADVERIDILKDASATALYGARAANGVIVITTKKAETGPPSIFYSFTGSFATRPRYSDRGFNMMNSKERVDVSREMMNRGVRYADAMRFSDWIGYEKAYLDFYKNGSTSFDEFERQSAFFETINTDWLDILTKDVFSSNHALSISGGNESVRYYLSGGYVDEKGNIRGESNKRFTANLKSTLYQKNYTLQWGVNGYLNRKHYIPAGVGAMNYAYLMSRAIPAYVDGEPYYYNVNGYPFNIINEIDESGRDIEQYSMTGNVQLQYRLMQNWRLDATLSYSYGHSADEEWFSEKTHYATSMRNPTAAPHLSMLPFGGELTSNATTSHAWTARLQTEYHTFLDESNRHFVNIALGGEAASTRYIARSEVERGYYPERGKTFPKYESAEMLEKYKNFAMWQLNNYPQLRESPTNMLSAYTTLTYSFRDRYIFNFNTRVDFSNAFGSRSREKLFPVWSVSGRWNMKEDIVRSVRWIDNLALRVSYGLQGNMLTDQPTRTILTKEGYDVNKESYTARIFRFANPQLKWEKTHSYNVGLDFSLWRDKVTGTISYYMKNTHDAFETRRVSSVTGVSEYVVNSATIRNQGVEISLEFTPIKGGFGADGKRGFTWRCNPNIGEALNQFINKKLNNEKPRISEPSIFDFLEGNIQRSGSPMNSFYSFRYAGLDRQGRPTFGGLEEERKGELAQLYKDKYATWRYVLEESGTRVPVFQGGIYNYFSYRNFSLSFMITYSLGNKIRLLNIASGSYGTVAPLPPNNLRREYLDRWRYPGDEKKTDIPAIRIDGGYDLGWWSVAPEAWDWKNHMESIDIYRMYDYSSLRVASGNYLRLQSVDFTYMLPERACDKLGIASASFYVAGSNLFVLCSDKLKGQSPEQSGSSSVANISIRPNYSLGFSVNF